MRWCDTKLQTHRSSVHDTADVSVPIAASLSCIENQRGARLPSMWNRRAKRLVRQTIGLPVISDGLRWFLRQETVPSRLRTLAHKKLAKAALFGSRTFKYETDGTVLELTHTATPNYLYWLGEYEPETLAVFTQLARTSNVIFDVGAADGLYSIFAAAANPGTQIN